MLARRIFRRRSDTLVVPMAVTDFNGLPSGSYRVHNEGVPMTWSMAANNALANMKLKLARRFAGPAGGWRLRGASAHR